MKTGDKIRIMTSSEYKKYVANHDVPDLFTGTFAEKYMGKQGVIEEVYKGLPKTPLCKISADKGNYCWPDYMLIKVSDTLVKGGITSNSFSASGEMEVSKEGAKKIKAMLDNSQKYAISSSISAEEMQSRLTAFKDKCFEEVKSHEEKTENPFEVTEKELKLFGLSKMDVLLRAIADPTLEVEVTIRRKKSAMVVYKNIELHDADSDKLVPIEVNSIRDNFLIVRGDKGRKKHPYANSVITFTDGHKEYFRESPIQICKKIREASLC